MPRYTFVTTYIIEAPDEAKARETGEKIEPTLSNDTQVVEHWTRLTDVEEPYEEEVE